MKARAVVADGKGSFSIDEIDVGDPGPEMVMGQEGAGVVSAVGAGVTNVIPGERPCPAATATARRAAEIRRQLDQRRAVEFGSAHGAAIGEYVPNTNK